MPPPPLLPSCMCRSVQYRRVRDAARLLMVRLPKLFERARHAVCACKDGLGLDVWQGDVPPDYRGELCADFVRTEQAWLVPCRTNRRTTRSGHESFTRHTAHEPKPDDIWLALARTRGSEVVGYAGFLVCSSAPERPGIYVDFLEVAPGQGFGSLLLASLLLLTKGIAVDGALGLGMIRSEQSLRLTSALRMDGDITLFSVPKAVGFYEESGMVRICTAEPRCLVMGLASASLSVAAVAEAAGAQNGS
jgi:GNAT superfamily N-acetyltransferase